MSFEGFGHDTVVQRERIDSIVDEEEIRGNPELEPISQFPVANGNRERQILRLFLHDLKSYFF